MFKEYGQPYDTNTVFAGAATNPPGKINIQTLIERAKQLAICRLKFSLLAHWNIRKEACLDPDEVRQAAEKDCLVKRPSIAVVITVDPSLRHELPRGNAGR